MASGLRAILLLAGLWRPLEAAPSLPDEGRCAEGGAREPWVAAGPQETTDCGKEEMLAAPQETRDRGEEEPVAMLQALGSSWRDLSEGQLEEQAAAHLARFASAVRGGDGAGGRAAGEPHASCKITAEESCNISSLAEQEWTVIHPAGEGSPYQEGVNMQCIDGSPFSFSFWRGSRDRLLIFFQGGGACWNSWSTHGIGSTGPLCTTSAKHNNLNMNYGPLNMMNDSNPFRNHSVLSVTYCSGDAFAGDVVQPYGIQSDPWSPRAVQKGYRHMLAALDWVQSNEEFDGTSPLEDLTVQGCSAGTLAIQIWANALLGRFAYEHARVALDSWAGVFPHHTQSIMLQNWGTCDLPILAPAQQAECRNPSGLFAVNLTVAAMANHKSARFVTINSKTDAVQRYFYTLTKFPSVESAILKTLRHGLHVFESLDAATYYHRLNKQVLEIYRAHENWQGFLVDGASHCFCFDKWLDFGSYSFGYFWSGPLGAADDTGSPRVAQNLVDLEAADPPPFICEGEGLDPADAADDNQTYCDINLL